MRDVPATSMIAIIVIMTASMPFDSERGPSLNAVAAPSPLNPISLELITDHLEAEVANDQNGVVIYEGTVTVDQSRLMNAVVTLSASCIWPAIVSPSTMEFQGPGIQEFTVTVVVPPKTSSLMVGQVLVSGSYKAPGMPVETDEVSAMVTVAQYHKSSVLLSGRFLHVTRGSTESLEITIYNEGNGPVMYELQTDAPEWLMVTFSQGELELGADEQATVLMNVSAERDASRGDHRVTVAINEVGASPQTSTEQIFTVRVGMLTGTWVIIAALVLVSIGVAIALWKGRLPALRRVLSRKHGEDKAG